MLLYPWPVSQCAGTIRKVMRTWFDNIDLVVLDLVLGDHQSCAIGRDLRSRIRLWIWDTNHLPVMSFDGTYPPQLWKRTHNLGSPPLLLVPRPSDVPRFVFAGSLESSESRPNADCCCLDEDNERTKRIRHRRDYDYTDDVRVVDRRRAWCWILSSSMIDASYFCSVCDVFDLWYFMKLSILDSFIRFYCYRLSSPNEILHRHTIFLIYFCGQDRTGDFVIYFLQNKQDAEWKTGRHTNQRYVTPTAANLCEVSGKFKFLFRKLTYGARMKIMRYLYGQVHSFLVDFASIKNESVSWEWILRKSLLKSFRASYHGGSTARHQSRRMSIAREFSALSSRFAFFFHWLPIGKTDFLPRGTKVCNVCALDA